MCIFFIYRNPKADSESYRLIIASNRDEIVDRPTLPAHHWKNYEECIGGIDMETGKEGGTWLAVSTKGKGGVLLNLKETSSDITAKKGRGCLVSDFVTSTDSIDEYLNKLHKENQENQSYNPYNLILFNLLDANTYYLNSSSSSVGPQSCNENVLGFGNTEIERPYKKVIEGQETFGNIVQNSKTNDQEDLIQNLLRFLKSEKRHLPDPELQRVCPSMYEELSSIFVSVPSVKYGTRTHTIILVDNTDQLTYVEETLMPDNAWKRQCFVEKLTR